ncbi:histone deacetylase [Calidifontibacter sp. DB0510]|uniref:Histone deacetylase n=1 Tax=Metallococcus carri TaxID=1656884 RepID=A0A967AZ51_9MICO|nr:histone deacetylase [Metallococcus carri]NHN54485.1 histone deacetylase [Metallococcus carri]NOP36676.1 histone deacetylase [Calidifontibacter sp. DB2511S]
MPDLLWYAAYGSNLSAARFGHYLAGGRPEGAARTMAGARDATPPRDTRALELPGSIFFGWESPTWGGGIAFYDPDRTGRALASAYLISREQFVDLLHQEMHREVGDDLDLGPLWDSGGQDLGPGRYERLLRVDELEELPVVTFTCPRDQRPAVNPPADAYLTVIARGLAETHALDADAISAYFVALEGVSQTPEHLRQVVRAALG